MSNLGILQKRSKEIEQLQEREHKALMEFMSKYNINPPLLSKFIGSTRTTPLNWVSKHSRIQRDFAYYLLYMTDFHDRDMLEFKDILGRSGEK